MIVLVSTEGSYDTRNRPRFTDSLFHKFSDSRTIQGILPFLDDNDANLRSAAILTLRHSLIIQM